MTEQTNERDAAKVRELQLAALDICLNRNLQVINRWLASHTPSAEDVTPEQMQRIGMCVKEIIGMRRNLDIMLDPALNRSYLEYAAYCNQTAQKETDPTPTL